MECEKVEVTEAEKRLAVAGGWEGVLVHGSRLSIVRCLTLGIHVMVTIVNNDALYT